MAQSSQLQNLPFLRALGSKCQFVRPEQALIKSANAQNKFGQVSEGRKGAPGIDTIPYLYGSDNVVLGTRDGLNKKKVVVSTKKREQLFFFASCSIKVMDNVHSYDEDYLWLFFLPY